ncbi:MAG: hypothetical protein JXR83_16760, partial [Deltaproteobacteria bacterium]|nr:hypothetical protein [Deltaproteobacteria bacterium]
MPRRKKLDLDPVIEGLISEIEFRVARTVKEGFFDLGRRLDRLERQLAGRGGRVQASQDIQ